MAEISVILQDERIAELEHEKAFLLAILRDIENIASRGEIDSQMLVSGIKQIRGQLESGEVHRKNIRPGLVR